tara:strand:- start:145 stop:345 length:201 start_codon:yes stop_codon:yes gene_type:complete
MDYVFLISFSLIITICLYNLIQNILYRESIARLERTIDELRQANRNLSEIIQEDIQKKADFEADCG